MRAVLVLVAVVGLSACDRVYGLEGRGDPVEDTKPFDGLVGQGLVAWFPMDNAIEDRLRDTSGHDLFGLCDSMLCPVPSEVGKVEGALYFDGTRVIGVNPDPILETTSGFTIAAWYRIRARVDYAFACPFNKVSTGGNNSWQLCFSTLHQVQFFTDDGNGTDNPLPGGILQIGVYQHVVLWWNGTEKRIYIDGLLSNSEQATTTFANGKIGIGADYDDGVPTAPFDGDLDDLRIYNRPLEVSEIADLVAQGS